MTDYLLGGLLLVGVLVAWAGTYLTIPKDFR